MQNKINIKYPTQPIKSQVWRIAILTIVSLFALLFAYGAFTGKSVKTILFSLNESDTTHNNIEQSVNKREANIGKVEGDVIQGDKTINNEK